MRHLSTSLLIATLAFAVTTRADAHCQIPCGIYDDELRVQEIQDLVADYFLCQRIKAPESKDGKPWEQYVAQLTTLHQIEVAAMKAKQTTDLANVEALRSLIATFRTAYFGEAGGHSH
jgi:nickel superoxide dismutase